MAYAPVILVVPSFATLRTIYGIRKKADGTDDTDENGGVPDAVWYKRSNTPPIWKMKDGTPYTDPDTGLTVTPRVRDLTSTKFAIIVVLEVAEAIALNNAFPNNVFAGTHAGRANAMAFAPELEWSALGQVWGREVPA